MLGFIKRSVLAAKQKTIKRLYPGVNMNLNKEMPLSAVGMMPGLARRVDQINKLESAVAAFSDEQLRAKTQEFRALIAAKARSVDPSVREMQETLLSITIQEEKDKVKERIKLLRNTMFAEILPEAFAVVREASRRTIGLRHFDVQIAGGIVLHEGKIAEMATGEGKTLVATLAVYLVHLTGRHVYVVTVNDYLAKRDAEWMGPIYKALGLTVGAIQSDMDTPGEERKAQYRADVTYGTNNEFGCDYLRGKMKVSIEQMVQSSLEYASATRWTRFWSTRPRRR